MSEQKITAWSYSRYGLYETCPFKAKLLYIDKFKEESSPAMAKGIEVHSQIERYLKLKDEPLPQSGIKLCADLEELKTKRPFSELEVAFSKTWLPVDWFAKDAWVRIKIDALVKDGDYCHVIDFKTGRVRDSYEPQLELYALTGLLMFPSVNTVDTELWFVDAGRKVEGQRYTRDDLEMLKARWTDRVTPMLEDVEFRPTPNQYCKNCHFRKGNAGICEAA